MHFIICLAGPTASGKTELSLTLAEMYQAEIVSFDSRQFYKELTIGTAKPNEKELSRIPHHFINYCSITEALSAGTYAQKAYALIQKRRAIAPLILVGGSGLYIRALLSGLDTMAEVPPEIRNWVIQEYHQNGLTWLQEQVAKTDPVFWNGVDPQNPQRLMRALEVYKAHKKPYSSFLNQTPSKDRFNFIPLGLELAREELYAAIETRVDRMMESGLLNEVDGLSQYAHLSPLKTVGYKELFMHLQGNCSLDEAVAQIKQHTRNYAKRQITWFKNQMQLQYFNPGDLTSILSFINAHVSA